LEAATTTEVVGGGNDDDDGNVCAVDMEKVASHSFRFSIP
jgi:hypothetical protein